MCICFMISFGSVTPYISIFLATLILGMMGLLIFNKLTFSYIISKIILAQKSILEMNKEVCEFQKGFMNKCLTVLVSTLPKAILSDWIQNK